MKLAAYAALLADDSRAAMCLAMIDGRAWTATELAREAGISASTASEHLSKLVAAGICAEARQGRHRYIRLATPEVARLVEDLAALAGHETPTGLRQVKAADRLARGRTCYDHLAGDLGVSVRDAMITRGILTGSGLTDHGRQWFADLLGPEAMKTGRPLIRDCLDWTRRVPHLGGALGAAFCTHALNDDWIRRPNNDREVALTDKGRQELEQRLSVR